MAEYIQLLSVENSTSRKHNPLRQQLEFNLLVTNLGYSKQVDVLWAGEDGIWHCLSADYLATRQDNREYWQARIVLKRKPRMPLAGDIQFVLRLIFQEKVYWDRLNQQNYFCVLNSGLQLAPHVTLHNLTAIQSLENDQTWLTIKVAINNKLTASKVEIHWTVDNWRHTRISLLRRGKAVKKSNCRIWSTRLKVANIFKIQYAICAVHKTERTWDNNGEGNYIASHKPLNILILNLHCYQEANQDEKLWQIARAIDEQAVDVVCLQEVAEHWQHGQGDWSSNAANIINQRLKKAFQLYTDWSHIGFDRYKEGVAILSRYAINHTEARYVSDKKDIYNIHSRKVVMANIDIPFMGAINVFSAHLSWWKDGFASQFQSLSNWAAQQSYPGLFATLLCGDFNVLAGSTGYQHIVAGQEYDDQYLAANAPELFAQIFRIQHSHWQNQLANDYRIDYIFMHKTSQLQVTTAHVLFTETDYGQVSDHCGYLMTFEPK